MPCSSCGDESWDSAPDGRAGRPKSADCPKCSHRRRQAGLYARRQFFGVGVDVIHTCGCGRLFRPGLGKKRWCWSCLLLPIADRPSPSVGR